MSKIKTNIVVNIVIIVVALLCIIGGFAIFSFNDTEYTITITDKERIYTGGEDGESKYLVFGDDENGTALVFENTDNFIRGKWNSSNVQGQLKIGNTYKITVVGYRIPFFSSYQNIIEINPIE